MSRRRSLPDLVVIGTTMRMNISDISNTAVRHRTLLLVLLGALLYVAFLGLRDLWYPDELDIAEVARAMFLSGDWVSPRRMGVIWVDYPPMIYWAGSIFAHLFDGMSAFSLRLPNALAAIGTVVITCAVGTRWYNARAGLWGGFALLTFLTFVNEANSYRPDVLFTLMITSGITVYAYGAAERPRLALRIAGFAFLGLAMLAKGPLGLLLPGLVLTLWHGARHEWRRILELAPLSLVSLAIYLPWFAATGKAMGWDNILYELYAQNFARFLDGEFRGHAQPFYYYFKNFWIDFAPWSWLAPSAIWWTVRSGRWRDPRVQLVLWWFGAFFVFLSVAATKRQLYLLPAYPALALLLAPWLASIGRSDIELSPDAPRTRPVRIYSLILAVAFSVVGIGLFGFLAKFASVVAGLDLNEQELEVAHGLRVPLAVLGTVLLASGFWIVQAWRRDDTRAAVIRIGAAHVALYVVILAFALPAFEPTKSYASQSQWIREQIGSETNFGMVYPFGSKTGSGKVVSSGLGKRGGFAYHTGAMVDLLYNRAEVESFFREHPGSVVLIHEGSVEMIFSGQESAWRARVVGELRTGKHLYIVVRAPLNRGAPESQESVPENR
ncbi:MAG: ArnT family glycosyltransferase [Woeseia sp.]